MIECGGADADKNFGGADLGFGGIGVAKYFGSAVFGIDDGFHGVSGEVTAGS